MKKEKFYYSQPCVISDMEILLSREKVVATSDRVRKKKDAPRITICSIYDDVSNTMSFGVARCSGNDMFRKAIGQELSRRRAEENPFRVVQIHPSQKVSDVFRHHVLDIESQVESMTYPIKINC